MSCKKHKQHQKQSTVADDLLSSAIVAVDAVRDAVVGARVFQKTARMLAKAEPSLGKLSGLTGFVGASFCMSSLLDGDFVPSLAQAIERAWPSKPHKKRTPIAEKEETASLSFDDGDPCASDCFDLFEEKEDSEEAFEVLSFDDDGDPCAADCFDACGAPACDTEDAAETSEEAVEAFAACEEEKIAPVLEEAADASVAGIAADHDADSDEDGEAVEDEGFYAYNTAHLDFIDVMADPAGYEALLERERRGEIKIVTRYRRSFSSNLLQSQGEVQEHYSAIKNKLLSYKGVKSRLSWAGESFKLGGKNYVAKMNVKGNTVHLYLALEPAYVESLEDGKYKIKDLSSQKKYENVPTLFKIKGPRQLKYALELIDEVCRVKLALPNAKKFKEIDYTKPFTSTEELVKSGDMKMLVAAVPAKTQDDV